MHPNHDFRNEHNKLSAIDSIISEEVEADENAVSEKPEVASDVAKGGSIVTYRKLFATKSVVDTTLQPHKFPLHKKLEGHKPGDIIRFQGKEYELLSVIN